ncbi:MAG: histidine ammonia-lyase [Bacillota bacterium]|jgi:histidine ammonia-lyase
MMTIAVDGNPKTIEEIARVAFDKEAVEIPLDTWDKMQDSRQIVDDIVSKKERVYGINTGFGKFADVAISVENIRKLQTNLVLSHSVAVGELFSEAEVRAAMFLRANALAKGMSGIRPEVVNTLCSLLNKNVIPYVPQKGSVGASGDLAPLSHISLVLLGKGYAFYEGELLPGQEALKRAEIAPVELEAKEGLALTNGVQMTAAVLALTIHRGYTLAIAADIIASLTGQALRVVRDAYDQWITSLRPHTGAQEVGENLRALLEGSQLATVSGEVRVQDPYVLRCIPQVHGAVRQALDHVASVVEIESGSATDNPMVLPDGRVISGGNFHGQPLSIAGDYLGIALCSFGNMSERRMARMMDHNKSGLPSFLTKDGGLNSGFMIMQYTAASIASECKVLAHPASVDTIPTSADQEDHVSMSATAARKAREICNNVSYILALEYLAACQALEFRGPELLSPPGSAAYNLLRSRVPKLCEDREMHDDIEAARALIVSGELENGVNQVAKNLL